MEENIQPESSLLTNSAPNQKFCKWKAVQKKNGEVNDLHDNNSMNSNFSKHCCNVSFNTAQKVHYYEAERTNKKSKAGLWLQL